MKPNIYFKILEIELSFKAYSLFMFLGGLLAITVSLYNIKKAGLSIKSSLLRLLSMVIGMLLGARILNVLINWDYYMVNSYRIFSLNTAGFSLMGGLILASIFGLVTSILLKLDIWQLGDSIVPGLGLGLVFMRMGCFLNGCCYGLPSKLPWSVTYPYNSLAHKYYLSKKGLSTGFSLFKSFASPSLHPTQIYEMIGILLGMLLALVIIKKKKTKGLGILSFSLVFTITRLINHFFRVHPDTNIVGFSFYPILYIVIILILSSLLYIRIKSKE